MKSIKTCALLLLLLWAGWGDLFAWQFQLGVQRLNPQLGAKDQEYTDETGTSLTFSPEVEKTIFGSASFVGLVFEPWGVQISQSSFTYESTIEASNAAVESDTQVSGKIEDRRLAVNYHLERELAGFYLGTGVSQGKETLEGGGHSWTYEGTSPLLQYGIDMIFGLVRIRAEQIHYRLGRHNLKTSSLGVMAQF